MSKINKLTIAYLFAVISLTFLIIIALVQFGSTLLPSKNTHTLTPSLLAFTSLFTVLPLGIFYLLGVKGIKKNKRFLEALSLGFVYWLYIVLIPGLVVTLLRVGFFEGNLGVVYLFSIIQTFISVYLIFHFKLPKTTIILAFIIPGMASLYFLIYGTYKNNKLKEQK